MTPRQIRCVKDLLARAVELSPAGLDEFLSTECPDDPEVRAEVRRLLAAETLDSGSAWFSFARAGIEDGETDAVGTRVGPYHVVRRIGEGGMGVVYEAEQHAPVRRRVALKLIKRGMDTRQVLARFESERQALALMRHPSIASVYDGGATEQGRPYFAMELVDGVPITAYCDERRLGTRDRLQLFAAVCAGVQHAHQKGVIHRDIKPTNVLVEERDGAPVPKIIDFGVAKATEQRRAERLTLTELGQIIGTPGYMSPEQARAGGQDIDTRTDVYSLGVLLYELLVGALPFDVRTLQPGGGDELRRRILEDEPSRPSDRFGTLGAAAATHAARRRTDPAGLRRQLRGDLDWIAMRALEKERDRRYPSPSELAADVLRHLRHEPIAAGPPSITYRMRKFARRHRVGFAASAAVAAAVLGGTAFSVAGFVRALRAERVAVENARTAESVTGFLVDLFQLSDPGAASGSRATARELLDRGSDRIAEVLADEPVAQSSMMVAMGRAYRGLGLYPQAQALLARGVATQRERLEPDDPRLVAGLRQLGALQLQEGRPAEAEATFREALERTEARHGPRSPELGPMLRDIARALQAQARYDEARSTIERSRERIAGSLGADGVEYALSNAVLAWTEHSVGEHARALEIYDDTLAILERESGGRSVDLAWSLADSAVVLTQLRELDEAQARLERSIGILEDLYGPWHPGVATMLDNLGTVQWYRGAGAAESAVAAYERAIAIRESTLGPDHPDLAGSLNNLGLILRREKRYDEAREAFERARSIFARALGEDHPRVAGPLVNLGWVARSEGRHAEALRYYEEALAIRETRLGATHPEVARVLEDIAGTYAFGLQDAVSALPRAERAHAILGETFGQDHLRTRNAHALVGKLLCRNGDLERALPILESFLEYETARLGEGHRAVGTRHRDLGECLLTAGDLAGARAQFERAVEIHRSAGYRGTAAASALTGLARVLDRIGEVEEAERRFVAAIELLREEDSTTHPEYGESVRAYEEFRRRRGLLRPD